MVPTSVSFRIGVSEPDSYLLRVDLSPILSAVNSKLHAWPSHVIVFLIKDLIQQLHSYKMYVKYTLFHIVSTHT